MFKQLRLTPDLASGVIFSGFGAAFLIVGRDYPIGTVSQMDSGFMPMVLGWLLLAIGMFLVIKGMGRGVAPMGQLAIRAWILVPCGFLAFALLIDKFGLIAAAASCMLVAAIGGVEFRWREQLILTACVVSVAVVVFSYLLRLPLHPLPVFMR